MVLEYDLFRLHEQLTKAWARSTDSTLHIFVAGLYTDSAVALKILTDILRSESRQYSVFPVYGYDDILFHSAKGISSTQPYTAVFLNCGATEDVLRLLGAGPHARIFVLDCHRPIHLANIRRDNHKVVVAASREADEDHFLSRIYDTETGGALLAEEGSADELQLSSDGDLGSDSRGGDGEDDDGDDDDDDGFVEVSGQGAGEGAKRRRRGRRAGRGAGANEQQRQRRKQEMRERRRLKMEYYNRGSLFGRPAGLTLYDMAHLLRKDTSEHLWLACVAVTDHFIHCRVAPEHYTAACAQLEQKVNSLNTGAAPRVARTEDGLVVKTPVIGRIDFEPELRLMCLQRWNLFDALALSTYSCTRLQTWSEPGKRRVRLLLGEMGVKHSDARERFSAMTGISLSRLKDDLGTFGASHGLDQISFRAFHLSNGYKTKVSASDVVYGVTALLESGEWHTRHQGDSFWTALSALDLKGWKILESGMDEAIKVQGAIVEQGSLGLLKKSAIKTTFGRNKFQYLILEDSKDSGPLAHPLALTRLLHFLMDAQKEQGQRPRPMVVAASPPSSSVALVVGLPHRPALGQVAGNKFGIAFARAAERLGASYRQEMFESSFLELGKAHISSFIRILGEVMNDDGAGSLGEGP